MSVFVALKAPHYIDLTLHLDPNGQIPAYTATPIHAISTHVTSAEGIPKTVALGKHLHVAVVTLVIPDTVDPLVAGNLYGYNLRFFESPQDALTHATTAPDDDAIISLAQTDWGLLTPEANRPDGTKRLPLGYAANRLPSFSLPPKDFDQFNLIHGSCRKPHGEGDDMLAALDDLMTNGALYNDPLRRPHLLLVGGDQIYADDVSPPLLRALHDASRALLGWDEVFYGTGAIGGGFQDDVQAVRLAAMDILNAADNTTFAVLSGLLDSLTTNIDNITVGDDSIQGQIKKQIAKGLETFGWTLTLLRDSTTQFTKSQIDAVAQAIWIGSTRMARSSKTWHPAITGARPRSMIGPMWPAASRHPSAKRNSRSLLRSPATPWPRTSCSWANST